MKLFVSKYYFGRLSFPSMLSLSSGGFGREPKAATAAAAAREFAKRGTLKEPFMLQREIKTTHICLGKGKKKKPFLHKLTVTSTLLPAQAEELHEKLFPKLMRNPSDWDTRAKFNTQMK